MSTPEPCLCLGRRSGHRVGGARGTRGRGDVGHRGPGRGSRRIVTGARDDRDTGPESKGYGTRPTPGSSVPPTPFAFVGCLQGPRRGGSDGSELSQRAGPGPAAWPVRLRDLEGLDQVRPPQQDRAQALREQLQLERSPRAHRDVCDRELPRVAQLRERAYERPQPWTAPVCPLSDEVRGTGDVVE